MDQHAKLPRWVFVASLLIPCIGFAVALRGPNMLDHMGAEYDSIGRALASGRGFSDPFEIRTGPTAWMPPVLPTLLAVGYWVTDGNRNVVMGIFVVLQGSAICLTTLLVLSESIRLRRLTWGLAILAIGILANFQTLFQVTHDHALLLPIAMAIFLAFVHAKNANSKSAAVWQGAFGGFTALCSPVMATAWALGLVACWRHSKQLILISALVSITAVAPWMIRNRVALGKWIPIKSAGKFEFWQSMCPDNGGLLSVADWLHHPWNKDNQARRHYTEVGEIAFIDSFGPEIKAKLQTNPVNCIDRVINRFLAATLLWNTVSVDKPSPTVSIVRTATFACPFLSVLVILFGRNLALTKQEFSAIWIYACVLMPYVLVSYYERYAAPLIGIKMLLVLYAINRIHDDQSRSEHCHARNADPSEGCV